MKLNKNGNIVEEQTNTSEKFENKRKRPLAAFLTSIFFIDFFFTFLNHLAEQTHFFILFFWGVLTFFFLEEKSCFFSSFCCMMFL